MMDCRKRGGVDDVADECSEDGGVVKESPATNEDADIQDTEGKTLPRDVDLIAAEISTIDAIFSGVKAPNVNGIEDLSDTTSVSDDTPPSTPSSRGSSAHRKSRKRKQSLQESHVTSSSSPARGNK